MAGARTVKLKEDPKPKGPAIRIYRDEDGFSFIVGTVNKDGVSDFRTESLHNDFNEAVKQAESRVAQFRLPLINDTGVEFPTKAQPAAPRAPAPQTKAQPAKREKTAAEWGKELDELASPFAKFYDPDTSPEDAEKFYAENGDLRAHHAHLWFKERRALAIEHHEQLHGASRDHAVLYSQKLHDQIQTQIFQLYGALYDERARILVNLKAAHRRIAELESRPAGLNYRGIFHQGDEYQPQDCVTWSGSMWVAKRQTTDKPGETEGDDRPWVLACKRGRDGKDLRNAT